MATAPHNFSVAEVVVVVVSVVDSGLLLLLENVSELALALPFFDCLHTRVFNDALCGDGTQRFVVFFVVVDSSIVGCGVARMFVVAGG